ncbi:cell division protein SepF [Veillonella intestinalis]|uniref:cell division protein SepF n=1 Tax=Veillonella intestinalis TaxID=2941341 RepID=UPI00203ED746|nr:cell division protein SepF [Veillonella intestinalis]
MSFNWSNIKKMFVVNDRDDYDEETYEDNLGPEYDEPAHQVAQTNSTSSAFRPAKTGGYNTVAQRPNAMKVVIVEPTVFEDSEKITNELRDMRPVVINFEKTDPHEAARIVDFVSGATFALDGKLEKIGKDIFICVPVNVTVDYNDKSYSDLSETFAWKEPQI